MKWHRTSLLSLAGFVAWALACDKTTSPPAPDASSTTGGAGRGGAGAAGGSGGSGAGGSGVAGTGAAGGSGGRDAAAEAGLSPDSAGPPADGPRDSSGEVIAGVSMPGGPCGQDCMQLYRQFSEGLVGAQRCTPGAPGQCTRVAAGNLGCGGCRGWVHETGEIAAIAARWDKECSGCRFFGQCHPVLCSNLEIAVCQALPSGGGTCVNMERERPCPPEAKNEVPCDSDKYDYCYGQAMGMRICSCYPHEKRWRCY